MKTTLAIIVTVLIIGGALFISPKNNGVQTPVQNVTVSEGKQIIEITAKGGYTPQVSTAQAGIPTILRVSTKGTFDCSASLRIPSLGISEILQNSGIKEFDLGTPIAGTLQGNCGMGMYPFEIEFN